MDTDVRTCVQLNLEEMPMKINGENDGENIDVQPMDSTDSENEDTE